MNVKVENLSFSYGKTEILKDISFETSGAKKVVLLGENGVGKTTFLRCLCALTKFSGNIFLDGKDVKSLKSHEIAKLIAYVPQRVNLGDGTVFETVLTGRRPHVDFAIGEKDMDAVEKILNKLDISRLAGKNVNKLSGGERQKVALARALAQNPKLLILDESSSNLDIKNKLFTSELISVLTKQEDITVISAMHDINSALSFGDAFLFFKDKKLLAFCAKEEVDEKLLFDAYGINLKIFLKEDGEKFVVY